MLPDPGHMINKKKRYNKGSNEILQKYLYGWK